MRRWPPQEVSPVAEAIGAFVLNWNILEKTVARIVARCCGETLAIRIVMAHMSNQQLCNALQALASDVLAPQVKEHLRHALSAIDILREHRNFYVHGFHSLKMRMVENTGPARDIYPEYYVIDAYASSAQARRKYKESEVLLEGSLLDELCDSCVEFNTYLAKVSLYLEWGIKDPSHEYATLPEKPPLPRKMQSIPLSN